MSLLNSTLRAKLRNKKHYTTLSLEINYVANWLIGWPRDRGSFTAEWFTARDGYQKGWPTLGATCDASIMLRSCSHKLPLEVISSLIRNEMSALADGDVGYARTWKPRCWGPKVPTCFMLIIRTNATFTRWTTAGPSFTADWSLLLMKQITLQRVDKMSQRNLKGLWVSRPGVANHSHRCQVRHWPKYQLVQVIAVEFIHSVVSLPKLVLQRVRVVLPLSNSSVFSFP